MIEWLGNNWIALLLVVLALRLLWSLWQKSDHRRYADVIAKSRNDPKCKYWLEGRKKERDFTDAQRREIYKRDKGTCQVSGKKVKNAPRGAWQHIIYGLSHIPSLGFLWLNDLGEIDHIIPNSLRGPAELWNGRLTRRIINRKRSNKPDRDFYLKLRERNEKVYLG